MHANECEKKIEIKIIDNNEWEPDMDFAVELYDIDTKKRLSGDDTRAVVTILDEDFPGTLGFKMTDIRVKKAQGKVDIVVTRTNGSDGEISCMIKTEPLNKDGSNRQNAIEYEDYIPLEEKLTFEHGETERIMSLQLMTENEKNEVDEKSKEDDEKSSEEEVVDVMFKVCIMNPTPETVKISKKNVCIVTIIQQGDDIGDDEAEKLLTYFLQQREPSWSQQFKNAVMLGPQIDQDNLIVERPSLSEALFHFATIGWKVLFAFIPPIKKGNGIPAFIVALVLIGIITAIVE